MFFQQAQFWVLFSCARNWGQRPLQVSSACVCNMRLSQLSWNWCCCMQILIKLLLNLTNAVLCVCYSRALWAVVPGLHSDQRGNIPLCSFWTKLSWKTQSREHSDTPCRLACSLVYGKMLTPVCISKLISFVFATHVYSPSMTAACNLHTRNAPAQEAWKYQTLILLHLKPFYTVMNRIDGSSLNCWLTSYKRCLTKD